MIAFFEVYNKECGAGFTDSLVVAMGRMEIGVTHATSLGLDQNLARTGRGNVHFSKRQRLSELLDDSSLHLGCHE